MILPGEFLKLQENKVGHVPITNNVDMLPNKEQALSTKMTIYENPPPPVMAVRRIRSHFEEEGQNWNNKYEGYQSITKFDPMVRACLNIKGAIIRKMFRGIKLRDNTQSEEEKKILKEAKEDIWHRLNMPELAYRYGKRINQDADIIAETVADKIHGITQIRDLPIQYMTILEKKGQQLTDSTKNVQILKRGVYVLNEKETNEEIFKPEKILHVSLDPSECIVIDTKDRKTYGVWSLSPMESLKTYMEWKADATMADILWRYANVPRRVFHVDLSMFDSRRAAGGTHEARRENARTEAQAALDKIRDDVEREESDQGYFFGNEVTVDYLEPKTSKYNAPNELIKQLDGTSISCLGVTPSAVGKEDAAFGSTQQSSVYSAMDDENEARILARALEDQVMKRHFTLKYGNKRGRNKYPKELIARLYFDIGLIFSQEEVERMKMAAVMSETGKYTEEEVRAMSGHDPMTDEQRTDHLSLVKKMEKAKSPMKAMVSNKEVAGQVTADKDPNRKPEAKNPSKDRSNNVKSVKHAKWKDPDERNGEIEELEKLVSNA